MALLGLVPESFGLLPESFGLLPESFGLLPESCRLTERCRPHGGEIPLPRRRIAA